MNSVNKSSLLLLTIYVSPISQLVLAEMSVTVAENLPKHRMNVQLK
ncbi:hypothetical protein [Bacillus sp. J33]|nr:hypothetical protein [Bacillus sp. J33]